MVVHRSCEAICNSNNLTSTTMVSSRLVLSLMDGDALSLDSFVSSMDKTMVMMEKDGAPPHGSIKMVKMATSWYFKPHLLHMSRTTKVT